MPHPSCDYSKMHLCCGMDNAEVPVVIDGKTLYMCDEHATLILRNMVKTVSINTVLDGLCKNIQLETMIQGMLVALGYPPDDITEYTRHELFNLMMAASDEEQVKGLTESTKPEIVINAIMEQLKHAEQLDFAWEILWGEVKV